MHKIIEVPVDSSIPFLSPPPCSTLSQWLQIARKLMKRVHWVETWPLRNYNSFNVNTVHLKTFSGKRRLSYIQCLEFKLVKPFSLKTSTHAATTQFFLWCLHPNDSIRLKIWYRQDIPISHFSPLLASLLSLSPAWQLS